MNRTSENRPCPKCGHTMQLWGMEVTDLKANAHVMDIGLMLICDGCGHHEPSADAKRFGFDRGAK